MNKSFQPRVLVLTHEYGRRIQGGLGRAVNGLFNSINTAEIVFDVYLLKMLSPRNSDLAHIYRMDSRNAPKCLYSGNYQTILHTAFQIEKYDVVHVMVNSPFTAECLKDIRTHYPDVKVVYSCHSMTKHEIIVRNNLNNELLTEAYLMETVDHIHLLSRTSLKYLSAAYPHALQKSISIIPNGIEETDYTEVDEEYKKQILNQLNAHSDDIIILCISRWSFGKGLEYLMDAIPTVIKRKGNVKFIVAGRKTESWENKVEEYVALIDSKIASVADHVLPLGWVNNIQRNTLFSMAHRCVMPSLLEYFPYGILEPMVCKVPIISSQIDSVEELLDGDLDCLFYPPNNSEELAEKIIYLIDDVEKAENITQNAYQKVGDLYQWSKISAQYIDMYQSLVGKVVEEN